MNKPAEQPSQGGCYVREKDGSLKRVEEQQPAAESAAPPAEKHKPKAKE